MLRGVRRLQPGSSEFRDFTVQRYCKFGAKYTSVIPICNPVYVIQICNLIDFGHDDEDGPRPNIYL